MSLIDETEVGIMELWNERAAIREHDGKMSRKRAEYLAAKDIQRILGELPECVSEAVKTGRER